MRAFLGWLRGEARHCQMAAIPTLAEEDAKRPTREHAMLVAERRLTNRMTAALVRLGIRNFNVKLVKAADRLASLRTPEGEPIPPHSMAELMRDMARLSLVRNQIRAIEEARVQRLQHSPQQHAHPMILLLAKVTGIGVDTADLLVHEVLTRGLRDHERWRVTAGSPARRTRAAARAASRASLGPATGGSAVPCCNSPGGGCGVRRTAH
jgi:transposase